MGGQREHVCLGCISEKVRCRKLIRRGTLFRGSRCTTLWCDFDLTLDLAGVTFNFGSAKVSRPIFETSFSNDKDIWIAATDYYMHFYIIVLFPLTTILQLINFAASSFLAY